MVEIDAFSRPNPGKLAIRVVGGTPEYRGQLALLLCGTVAVRNNTKEF